MASTAMESEAYDGVAMGELAVAQVERPPAGEDSPLVTVPTDLVVRGSA